LYDFIVKCTCVTLGVAHFVKNSSLRVIGTTWRKLCVSLMAVLTLKWYRGVLRKQNSCQCEACFMAAFNVRPPVI